MKISLRFLSAVLPLALAACATVTPYQPLQRGEGYAEQRIESNRYRVRFAGNSQTSRQTVETYLMYRAAEVTLSNGYDYFIQADRNTEAQTRYTETVSGFDDFGPFWRPRFGFGVGVGTSIPSTEYQADVDILMFKGKKPLNDTRAFDAREVKSNLEAQILRPEKKS